MSRSKRIPPDEIIKGYANARDRAGLHPLAVEYEQGWFMIYGHSKPRYRGAEIIHMTARLNERLKREG